MFVSGFCRVCGTALDAVPGGGLRRYCDDHAEEAGREAARLRKARQRGRRTGVEGEDDVLGTGNLGPHRDRSFLREARIVHDELIRLGLKPRKHRKVH